MASIKTAELKNGTRRYRVRVRVNGQSDSATFRRKDVAERWAARSEERMILTGQASVEQARARTFPEMVDLYRKQVLSRKALNTQTVQWQQLEFWRRLFADQKLSEVTTALIAEGKAVLAPRAATTINSYLAALSHCYSMAVKEWGWVPDNPVRNVWRLPQPRARTRFLSTEERGALLFYARLAPCPYVYPIVVVVLSTGPRKQEIRRLEWRQYNHERGEIYLEETKNEDPRTVRLFGHAREVMADLYRKRQPGARHVFPSPHDPGRPVDFRYSWEQALERAAIENFCFHDLRHSAASYLAMQGATLTDIKEILGHRTIVTTQKYTHLTRSHTDAVVERTTRAIF
ncbi:MAG TPA: site-specific integrase [Geobacteraceae bacterium]